LNLKVTSTTGPEDTPNLELETLRGKVEEVNDEVRAHMEEVQFFFLRMQFQKEQLRLQLNQQSAELNTLRGLPLNLPVPSASKQGRSGAEVCAIRNLLI
jgi:hypothetical protein